MTRITRASETSPKSEPHREDDGDRWPRLAQHFRAAFGREPSAAELDHLARCRVALAWRIAPPRRPSRGSRVIARW